MSGKAADAGSLAGAVAGLFSTRRAGLVSKLSTSSLMSGKAADAGSLAGAVAGLFSTRVFVESDTAPGGSVAASGGLSDTAPAGFIAASGGLPAESGASGVIAPVVAGGSLSVVFSARAESRHRPSTISKETSKFTCSGRDGKKPVRRSLPLASIEGCCTSFALITAIGLISTFLLRML
jgi:hypothetical protein